MANIPAAHMRQFTPENLDDIETVVVETDLLIIGGGNAGCFVATEAALVDPNVRVTIMEKAEIMRSILKKAGPDTPAKAIVFSLPTSEVAGFGFFDS